MWLLNTNSCELKECVESQPPPYAILSHTWLDGEVSFRELHDAPAASQGKPGFTKIAKFCQLAKSRGFSYGWADTCCIDKHNSADLSESINSMYRYYRDAGECLIYLSDVPPGAEDGSPDREKQLRALRSSRWFSRGWTLQELVAPRARVFLAADWTPIEDRGDLVELLADITGIDVKLLRDRDQLSNFCTAHRMSWASRRQTTRGEDMAYSLMGIFGINMPIIYGEGAASAFRRLQEEIIRTSFDQSIFVWQGAYETSGLLAKSPADFMDTPLLGLWGPVNLAPFTMTNVGLSIQMNVTPTTEMDRPWLPEELVADDVHLGIVGCDVWDGSSWVLLVLFLQPVPGATFYANGKFCRAYRRIRCDMWMRVAQRFLRGRSGPTKFDNVLVLQDEHFELVKRAIKEDESRLNRR